MKIYFNQIKGYFRPNINSRQNVCANFLGFMKSLYVLDPTESERLRRGAVITPDSYNAMKADKRTPQERWAQDNCLVILHDTGTGRTLICHSKSKELTSGLLTFLNAEVDALGNNCEFLARHLRYNRESIKRHLKETQKAGLRSKRRR